MRDRYYLSPEQYASLEPPSLRGTSLAAIPGFNMDQYKGSTLNIHRLVRDVATLALREYETVIALQSVLDNWAHIEVERVGVLLHIGVFPCNSSPLYISLPLSLQVTLGA